MINDGRLSPEAAAILADVVASHTKPVVVLTDDEIEALRKCVASAARGDPMGATEDERARVTWLAADALGKLRAAR